MAVKRDRSGPGFSTVEASFFETGDAIDTGQIVLPEEPSAVPGARRGHRRLTLAAAAMALVVVVGGALWAATTSSSAPAPAAPAPAAIVARAAPPPATPTPRESSASPAPAAKSVWDRLATIEGKTRRTARSDRARSKSRRANTSGRR